VRQEIPPVDILFPFGEVSRGGAVLARLMMLQSDSAHTIGESEKKIIMIVMVRTEKFIGLLDQPAVCR